MSRFVEDCKTWLTAVDEWIGKGETNLRSALRLQRNGRITRLRKVIIAKHHANALYDAELDHNSAFASWPQLYNAVEYMKKSQGDIRTINGLFNLLREKVVEAEPRFHSDEEPADYILDRISFGVSQRNPKKTNPSQSFKTVLNFNDKSQSLVASNDRRHPPIWREYWLFR